MTARHISSLQRVWKLLRRHPQAVALAGTLALLALIPVYYLVAYWHEQRQIYRKAVEQAPLVREILQRNCYECHGQDPKKIAKNLDILNHDQLVDSRRRIVVPGAPEDSLLMQRIADGSMPPEKEETRLPRVTEKELQILKDWILGGAPPLPAADPEHPTPSAAPYSELAAEAKAVFKNHCYECHNYKDAKGGIKILHHRLLVTVRKVVIPRQPEESKLYKLITTHDDRRMPPDADLRLSDPEIDTIRRWIHEGAPPFPKTK